MKRIHSIPANDARMLAGSPDLPSVRSARRAGFTLVEIAVTTVIVSIGVTALLVAMSAGTRTNAAGRKLTQAVFIAQELREWTLRLPFSDQDPGDIDNPPGPDGSDPQDFIDDLDDLLGYDQTGVTYSPPRDGQGSPIADMTDWSQKIMLTWRDPDNLATIDPARSSDIVYVEITISCQGSEILSTGWLVTRRE
ncbi:MAG: prepilin-type N-terminal cleavage/methylation domain-containing protein [Phycisphaerae bacterium]|nr:prepilin-type N-terminal cleavage/methylation domain-containing protein [Phycisphaerae bacterium]